MIAQAQVPLCPGGILLYNQVNNAGRHLRYILFSITE